MTKRNKITQDLIEDLLRLYHYGRLTESNEARDRLNKMGFKIMGSEKTKGNPLKVLVSNPVEKQEWITL